jgi:MFS family permease
MIEHDQHDPYAALRHPDYRCLLLAGVLASIGTEMQAVAIGWELYWRTRSAAILGLTGLAQFLPVLFLTLPAGHMADRFSRKRLLQFALGMLILASLGLAFLSIVEGPVPLVFLCLVCSGVGRAFSAPARTALLTQVVAPEHLGNAVTWNSSGWQIANVAGPAMGGLLVWWANKAAPAYILAALCALTAILLVALIRPRPTVPSIEKRTLGSLLAGVRFVFQTELLLAAITLDLFAVLLGGATALLPLYAKDILHVDAQGLGLLRAAPALGATVMALVMAHRPPLQRAGPVLLAAVAGFGLATIVFGLSTNFILSLAMLALTGALDNISVVVRGTLMQTLTPDHMRGRVAAINSLFISSSNELGGFESGMTAWLFGAVLSVVGGGVGTILVVLVVMCRWPALLRLGPLQAKRPVAEDKFAPSKVETGIQESDRRVLGAQARGVFEKTDDGDPGRDDDDVR